MDAPTSPDASAETPCAWYVPPVLDDRTHASDGSGQSQRGSDDGHAVSPTSVLPAVAELVDEETYRRRAAESSVLPPSYDRLTSSSSTPYDRIEHDTAPFLWGTSVYEQLYVPVRIHKRKRKFVPPQVVYEGRRAYERYRAAQLQQQALRRSPDAANRNRKQDPQAKLADPPAPSDTRDGSYNDPAHEQQSQRLPQKHLEADTNTDPHKKTSDSPSVHRNDRGPGLHSSPSNVLHARPPSGPSTPRIAPAGLARHPPSIDTQLRHLTFAQKPIRQQQQQQQQLSSIPISSNGSNIDSKNALPKRQPSPMIPGQFDDDEDDPTLSLIQQFPAPVSTAEPKAPSTASPSTILKQNGFKNARNASGRTVPSGTSSDTAASKLTSLQAKSSKHNGASPKRPSSPSKKRKRSSTGKSPRPSSKQGNKSAKSLSQQSTSTLSSASTSASTPNKLSPEESSYDNVREDEWMSREEALGNTQPTTKQLQQKIREAKEAAVKQGKRVAPVWNSKFQLLKEYFDEHGHSDIPTKFEKDLLLPRWTRQQRYQFKLYMEGRIPNQFNSYPERLEALRSINFQFKYVENKAAIAWQSCYQDYLKFLDDQSQPERTSPLLGRWIRQQRKNWKLVKKGMVAHMHSLTKDRLQRLKHIQFDLEYGNTDSDDEAESEAGSRPQKAERLPNSGSVTPASAPLPSSKPIKKRKISSGALKGSSKSESANRSPPRTSPAASSTPSKSDRVVNADSSVKNGGSSVKSSRQIPDDDRTKTSAAPNDDLRKLTDKNDKTVSEQLPG